MTAEKTRSRPYWMMIAAAAVVVAVVVAGIMLLPLHGRDSIAGLAALTPRDRRLLEPRLTGTFAWMPYRGSMRGSATEPTHLKLAGAAGDLAERADHEKSADAEHAAGVGLLLVEQTADAIARLRAAVAKAPDDDAAWSDLAAAEYAEALSRERPSLYPQALADADHALRLDARRPEALFNRALILERLGLAAEARVAWQRHLDVDSSSPWAVEARDRLAHLPRRRDDAEFRRELPSIESAVAAHDEAGVRRFVAEWPLQSRTFAESDWLGQWGASRAPRLLELSRAIGDALVSISGESLLHDAVLAIDRATPAASTTLAAAYATYRDGRIAYAQSRPHEAEPRLRAAARGFAAAGSPMALVARYYALCARLDQNDAPGARRELAALLDETPPRYTALRAQIEWELGLAEMMIGDWTAALAALGDAETAFVRLGERGNAAFVETLLADTLATLGRPDDAWAARLRSFAILATDGRDASRLAVALGAASLTDVRLGRLDAARALLRLEQDAARASADEVLLTDAVVREAVLTARLGDPSAAAIAQQAEELARHVADPAIRTRIGADADFACAAASLRSDPRRAATLATRAIDAYHAGTTPVYLSDALLLRARASRALARDADAARDLDEGMTALDRHPILLDADDAMAGDAIALACDRGDGDAAFAYAERVHGGRVTAPELQQRLRGSSVAVVEIASSPSELAVFAVDGRGLTVSRAPSSRDLYDAIVRPIEPLLARAREVIFVPDRPLVGVAFAALFDRARQRYLIESIAVATAESASSLERMPVLKPSRAVTVSLPTAGMAALPEREAETATLRTIYAGAQSLEPNRATFPAFLALARHADVIHIAGHTAQQPGEGEAALLFADRRVTWSAASEAPLPERPVVVVAACDTLRGPASREARARSIGAAFVAAGARDVIGTLTPIHDHDARQLFDDFHRHLATGLSAAEALRQTQIASIARHDGADWQALALMTRTIGENDHDKDENHH